MLKKISAILLLFLYLPSVIGVQLCAHYCGGELQSVSVYTHANEDLCCGTHAKHNCCNEENKIIKVKDSHKNPELKVFSFETFDELALEVFQFQTELPRILSSCTIPETYIDPPDIPRSKLYLYHCTFLI
ncbi:MAG: hypothetical protein IPI46_11090 [Bacteroidetes bacterium]|nr:hypothetical protein [Bacteroidota bacterium]